MCDYSRGVDLMVFSVLRSGDTRGTRGNATVGRESQFPKLYLEGQGHFVMRPDTWGCHTVYIGVRSLLNF